MKRFKKVGNGRGVTPAVRLRPGGGKITLPPRASPAPAPAGASAAPAKPLELESGQKVTALLALYSNLYSELRDKDSRLTQVAGWGVTGLSAGVLLAMATPTATNGKLLNGIERPLALALGSVALFLIVLILTIVHDRASVARRLNSLHVALGFFDPSLYGGNEILPPEWQGWGNKGLRDGLATLGVLFSGFILVIAVSAIIILFRRSGM